MKAAAVECHRTAIVHPGARLADGVRIGPYAVIGEHVTIGRDSIVEANSVVDGFTKIGERCRIFPFASVGLEPQDLKFRGEESTLEVGNDNVFREFVTIHRGTSGGGGRTVIGSSNLFMAYSHVAHDCLIGSFTIFANGASLAGHVLVDDHATIGAYSGIHQFCRVGRYAFVGGYTVATQDVLPFSRTVGNRARLYGINTVGLVRREFSRERINSLRHAFRILQQSKLNVSQAVARLEEESASEDVRLLIDFIRASKRGVVIRRGRERGEPL
ncbi:MAG TPA: acyl-ACP--UDP-N-acetylglucosamine O-acyltransferase [Vicinamibacteria bacterium]|jgi:UDP-N-acetylglucosamine acyltransferase